jgi:hypothetical protein
MSNGLTARTPLSTSAAPPTSPRARDALDRRAPALDHDRMKSQATALLVGLCVSLSGCAAKKEGEIAADTAKAAAAVGREILASNDKLKELADALEKAAATLTRKEFPKDLPDTLGKIHVPFDAASINHRGVTDLPAATLRSLLDYTAGVQALNRDSQQLKNALVMMQSAVEKAWKEEKEPLINFSVILRHESHGVIAELVPNASPFELKGDWPRSYTILERAKGQAPDRKLERFNKGALLESAEMVVPVEPKSTAFMQDRALPQLYQKLLQRKEEILGSNKGAPEETPGLYRTGEALAVELRKIAGTQ